MPNNRIQNIIDNVVTGFFFLDLLLNFFVEYQNTETFQTVRDHKKIAKRYIFSFWFTIDFISTFPFNFFSSKSIITRLFRLFRLPKLIRLLDLYKFNQLLKSFFSSSTRKDRIVA
jgi:hypothetical protein